MPEFHLCWNNFLSYFILGVGMVRLTILTEPDQSVEMVRKN